MIKYILIQKKTYVQTIDDDIREELLHITDNVLVTFYCACVSRTPTFYGAILYHSHEVVISTNLGYSILNILLTETEKS